MKPSFTLVAFLLAVFVADARSCPIHRNTGTAAAVGEGS